MRESKLKDEGEEVCSSMHLFFSPVNTSMCNKDCSGSESHGNLRISILPISYFFFLFFFLQPTSIISPVAHLPPRAGFASWRGLHLKLPTSPRVHHACQHAASCHTLTPPFTSE